MNTSESVLNRIQPKNKAVNKVITLNKQPDHENPEKKDRYPEPKHRIVKESQPTHRLELKKERDIRLDTSKKSDNGHTLVTKSGGRVLIRKGESQKKVDLREILNKSTGNKGYEW